MSFRSGSSGSFYKSDSYRHSGLRNIGGDNEPRLSSSISSSISSGSLNSFLVNKDPSSSRGGLFRPRASMFDRNENVGSLIDSMTLGNDTLETSKRGLKMSASMRIDPYTTSSHQHSPKMSKTNDGKAISPKKSMDELLRRSGTDSPLRGNATSPIRSDFVSKRRMTQLIIDPEVQKASPFKIRPKKSEVADTGSNGQALGLSVVGSTALAPPPDTAPTDNEPQVNHLENHLENPLDTKTNTQTVPATPKKSALQDGYWVSPPLSDLCRYSVDMLKAVDNLIVGRKGFGQVTFIDPVDLSQLDNLGNLLGNLIVFSDRILCVYPDEDKKAPEGTQLNVPAVVTLENCAPKNSKTGEIYMDANHSIVRKHMKRLQSSLEEKGASFITYLISSGTAIFRVEHFSSYQVPEFENDLFDDDDMNMNNDAAWSTSNRVPAHLPDTSRSDLNDTFFYKKAPKLDLNYEEHQPGKQSANQSGRFNLASSMDDFVDNSNSSRSSGAGRDEHDYEHDQELYADKMIQGYGADESQLDADLTFENPQTNVSSRSLVKSDGDGVFASEPQPSYVAETGDYIPDLIDVDEDLDNLVVPFIGQPEHQENQNVLETDAQAEDWISHLKRDERSDRSDYGIGDRVRAAMFQSVDISQMTDSSIYSKAAEQLRLPVIEVTYPVGRFSPGTDKLVIRNVAKESRMAVANVLASSNGSDRSKQNIQSALRAQLLDHSNVTTRKTSGLPYIEPLPSLTFTSLTEAFSSEGALHEQKVWELSAILFDDITALGLTESLDGLSEIAESKVIERYRYTLLSTWLEDYVVPEVDDSLRKAANNGDDLERIFTLITGHQITEAAKLCVSSGNLHLASLLPFLGSGDSFIEETAHHQIDDWIRTDSATLIPGPIQKIYELLAGNTVLTQSPKCNVSEALDWKRVFGLILWYHSTDSNKSIDEAVKVYTEAIQSDTNVAKPLKDDPSFMTFKILSLYNSINPDVIGALDFPSECWNVDFRIPWYLYILLTKSRRIHKIADPTIGDKICVNYGMQLLDEGLWLESIYVLSHIEEDNVALTYISKALSNNIHRIHDPVDGSQTLTFLLDNLKISKKFLFEVDALKLRWQGFYYDEAQSLISAEMWEEAHNTVISRVAPKAVISNDIEGLLSLLDIFQNPTAISSWSYGGGMYIKYAQLIKFTDSEAMLQLSSQDSAAISSTLQSLVDSLTEAPRDSGGNPEVRVALSIMAGYVFNLALNYTNISGSRLSQMKMSKNDYWKQTTAISSRYFLQKAYI